MKSINTNQIVQQPQHKNPQRYNPVIQIHSRSVLLLQLEMTLMPLTHAVPISAETVRSIYHKDMRKLWHNCLTLWMCHRWLHYLATLTGSLSLKVFVGRNLHHILDGLNEERSNWMRYVSPARTVEEQNLVACQSGLDIYFFSIKPLLPSQELKVWYCPEFAQRCHYLPLEQPMVNKNGKCV